MADVISNVGTGISFSGRAKDYDSLIGRGLALRDARNARKQKEFADATEFDLKYAADLLPRFRDQTIKEYQNFYQNVYDDAQKVGIDKAKQNAVLKRNELRVRLSGIKNNNDQIVGYGDAASKGLITPMADKFINYGMDSSIPDSEILKYNNPEAGITIRPDGNIFLQPTKPTDLKRHLTKYPVGELAFNVGDPVPGLGTKRKVTVTKGHNEEQMDAYAKDILTDGGDLKTLIFDDYENNIKEFPDLFSPDLTKKLQAQTDLAKKYSKNVMGQNTFDMQLVSPDYPPQGSMTERTKQPTEGSRLVIPIEGGNPATYPVAWSITETINAPNSQTFDLKTRVKAQGLPATFQMNTSNIGIAQTKKASGQVEEPRLVVLGKAQEFSEKDREVEKLKLWRDKLVEAKGSTYGNQFPLTGQVAKPYEPSEEEVTQALINSGKQVKERDVQVPFNDVKGSLKQKGIPVEYYEKQLQEYKKNQSATGVKSNTGGGGETKLTQRQKSALEAFAEQIGREPSESEYQKILNKYK